MPLPWCLVVENGDIVTAEHKVPESGCFDA